MTEMEPTPIVIDGGADRTSRLLVRAADERRDVTIRGVILDEQDQISCQNFRYLTARDSIYPKRDHLYAVSAFKLDAIDGEEMAAAIGREEVVAVTTNRSRKDFEDTFLSTNPSQIKKTIVVNKQRWMDTERPLQQEGSGPIYVPDARVHAVAPTLKALERTFGLVTASVVEMRSYATGQALIDQTNPQRTAAQSRSATQGIIEHTIADDWGEYNQLRAKVTERSYTTNAAVGSLAVISATLENNFTTEAITELLSEQPHLAIDTILSTSDVKQRPEAGILNPDTVERQGSMVSFSLAYDSEWSRANRILDMANQLAWLTS